MFPIKIYTCLKVALVLTTILNFSSTMRSITNSVMRTKPPIQVDPYVKAVLETLDEACEKKKIFEKITPPYTGDVLAQEIATYYEDATETGLFTEPMQEIKLYHNFQLAAEVVIFSFKNKYLEEVELIDELKKLVGDYKNDLINKFAAENGVVGLGISYNFEKLSYDKSCEYFLLIAFVYGRVTRDSFLSTGLGSQLDNKDLKTRAAADFRATRLANSCVRLTRLRHEVGDNSGFIVFPAVIQTGTDENLLETIMQNEEFRRFLEEISSRVMLIHKSIACIKELRLIDDKLATADYVHLVFAYTFKCHESTYANFTEAMKTISPNSNLGNISQLGMQMAQLRLSYVVAQSIEPKIEKTMVTRTFIVSLAEAFDLESFIRKLKKPVLEALDTRLRSVVGTGFAMDSPEKSCYFVLVVVLCDNYFENYYPISDIHLNAEVLVNLSMWKQNTTADLEAETDSNTVVYVVNFSWINAADEIKFEKSDEENYQFAISAVMNPNCSVGVARFELQGEDFAPHTERLIVISKYTGTSYKIQKPAAVRSIKKELSRPRFGGIRRGSSGKLDKQQQQQQ